MAVKNEITMELTEEELKETINNSHPLVVVDFFAEWCMPCLMLAPVIEELAERFQKVKFVQINVDDNEALSSRYHVSGIPCHVLFKKGKEVDRIIGLRDIEDIQEKIVKRLE